MGHRDEHIHETHTPVPSEMKPAGTAFSKEEMKTAAWT
jgi:hypothetical protein